MTRLFSLTAVLFTLAACATAAPTGKFTFVDLSRYANQKRDAFGGNDANDLKALGKPNEPRTLGGVNFKLLDSVVQLASPLVAQKRPAKIAGIKIGHACNKIHIIHATEFGNGSGGDQKDDDPRFIKDGTKIAEYKINYDDGSSAAIPVVYGQDVRDWWFAAGAKGVTRGKVAWQGDNEYAKSLEHRIRVYLTTWENPHPAKKIATIDYIKVGDGGAAPFCVAITLEAK